MSQRAPSELFPIALMGDIQRRQVRPLVNDPVAEIVDYGNAIPGLQMSLKDLRDAGARPARIGAVLMRLHSLGGLQSWRDYHALAEYWVGKRQKAEARSVLEQGLNALKSKPGMGHARRALRTLLDQIGPSPRQARRSPEPKAATRKAPDAPAAPVAPSAAQTRTTETASNASAAPPVDTRRRPRPAAESATTPDDVGVEVQVQVRRAPDLIRALTEQTAGGSSHRRAALLGHRVAVAACFDHLLCLESMCDVAQLPHQIETVKRVLRVLRVRALLADEVGLGKTIEAAMVLAECLQRSLVDSVLILVPAALVGQWREELASKFGLRLATTEDEAFRRDPKTFWRTERRIIASIEAARSRRHSDQVADRRYDLVIVDEAHRLKRSSTRGYQLVDRLRSRYLLLLTATPVENNLEELYNIITLLRPGQLATREAFRKRYVARGAPTSPRNAEELRGLLSEVMVRNTRALVDLRLPPRFASTVRCQMSPSEQDLYQRVRHCVAERYGNARERMALSTLLQIAGSSPRALARTVTKMLARPDLDPALDAMLRPLVNLARSCVEPAKAQRLLHLLCEAQAAGSKAVVFTRYRATLSYLEELLEWHGLPHAVFSGAMSGAEKDGAVRRLAATSDEPGAQPVGVMLATEVGGEGRNLQCASTLINYDLPWNPMKLEQRIGRLHRIGQTREVRIYNLCAAGSAEDRILDVLDRRINMFELVIGELDMILGQVEDDRDLGDRVLEIYGTTRTDAEVQDRFDRLGDELTGARERYEQTKTLDRALFGRDFEV